ncbi:MAG: UDP-N-acetyl-D-galactosamine dehydrogenase [Gammaproteobacteria bacterium]|jgi:UDP-N-acetyl-D-galactosamine dehydrogenase
MYSILGRQIHDGIGSFVTSKVIEKLAYISLPVDNLNVSILYFTYKENVPDVRTTRAMDMVRSLEEHNATVQVYDPIADTNKTFE